MANGLRNGGLERCREAHGGGAYGGGRPIGTGRGIPSGLGGEVWNEGRGPVPGARPHPSPAMGHTWGGRAGGGRVFLWDMREA